MSISPQPFVPPKQHLPPGTGMLAMGWFIAALSSLFLASIVAYVVVRLNSPNRPEKFGDIVIPHILWLSTVILLISSVTMHLALSAVRREKQKQFQAMLLFTLILSFAFVFVQTPALYTVLQTHWEKLDAAQKLGIDGKPMTMYGLVFFLIILHAAHVLGGIIPMAVTTVKAHLNRYNHEHHNPIRYLAIYWHFLDIVWIVMFAVMTLLG